MLLWTFSALVFGTLGVSSGSQSPQSLDLVTYWFCLPTSTYHGAVGAYDHFGHPVCSETKSPVWPKETHSPPPKEPHIDSDPDPRV